MIPFDPRLPIPPSDDYQKKLSFQLVSVLRDLGQRLDLLSSGFLSGHRNTATSIPTTGTWAKGDFVLNSTPTEAGAGGSKYIVHGWRCTVAGTPGTWLQCRFLTGN